MKPDMTYRPRRSALYMPASNVRAIEKARDLPCDVVILDLEDAVAPDAKAAARDHAIAAVRAGGFGRREVVIRVNGLDTPWGQDDLAAVAAAGPDAVLAPKVSSVNDIRAYAGRLAPGAQLWAMIETCAAMFRLEAMASAAAANRLTTWVIGSNDLAKEMRCRLGRDRTPIAGLLSQAVAAARMGGLTILDGVYNDIQDEAGLERQCAEGLAFGFDGKTLIHPRQVEIANRAFSPTSEEIGWARVVVQAFDQSENGGKGVIQVEGRMVERLHLDQARQTLELAQVMAT
jgi:citrate lyase subunit beta/citryl-CoA lyase